MASLKKRGRYYYGRWRKTVEGERIDIKKSLGFRYKKNAEEALQQLEDLEERGEINPYAEHFDPQKVLKELNQEEEAVPVHTVREAADYFYKKKSHLSKATVKNAENRTLDNAGAYERAIEHFISLNNIAELSPKMINRDHLEKVIFKPNIKPATRHFYFKQLRVWWNKLLEWKIVDKNYFPSIKKDLPKKRSNARPKMLSESEFERLIKAFDEDLKRKREIKEYKESRIQHWFKPLMSVYFFCGLRKHEAAYKSDLPYSGLKYENLFFDGSDLQMIYLPPTKGRRERSIPVPNECRVYLESYLEKRGTLEQEDYIFVYNGGRRKGYPVTGDQAARVFKSYIKKAGIPKSRTLHGMRHERITSWLESGYNTSEAQFMAGHSSSSVTNKYTHLRAKKLLEKQREIDRRNKEGGD